MVRELHCTFAPTVGPLLTRCAVLCFAVTQIVHCCGYDSVPFDLGVLLLADHARKQLNK